MTTGETGQQPEVMPLGMAASTFTKYEGYNTNRRDIIHHRGESGYIFPVDKKGNIIFPPESAPKEVQLAFAEKAFDAFKAVSNGKAAFAVQRETIEALVKYSNGRVGRNIQADGEGYIRAINELDASIARLVVVVNHFSDLLGVDKVTDPDSYFKSDESPTEINIGPIDIDASKTWRKPDKANNGTIEMTDALLELDVRIMRRWQQKMVQLVAGLMMATGLIATREITGNTKPAESAAIVEDDADSSPFIVTENSGQSNAAVLANIEAQCKELQDAIDNAIDVVTALNGFFVTDSDSDQTDILAKLCEQDGVPMLPDEGESFGNDNPDGEPRSTGGYSIYTVEQFPLTDSMVSQILAHLDSAATVTTEGLFVTVPAENEAVLAELLAGDPALTAALNSLRGILDVIRNQPLIDTNGDGVADAPTGGDGVLRFNTVLDDQGRPNASFFIEVTTGFSVPNQNGGQLEFTPGSFIFDTDFPQGAIDKYLIDNPDADTHPEIITLTADQASKLNRLVMIGGQRAERFTAGTRSVVMTDADGTFVGINFENFYHSLEHRTLSNPSGFNVRAEGNESSQKLLEGVTSVEMVNAGEAALLNADNQLILDDLQARYGADGTISAVKDPQTGVENIALTDNQGRIWWLVWVDIESGGDNGTPGTWGWAANWVTTPSKETLASAGTPVAPSVKEVVFGGEAGAPPASTTAEFQPLTRDEASSNFETAMNELPTSYFSYDGNGNANRVSFNGSESFAAVGQDLAIMVDGKEVLRWMETSGWAIPQFETENASFYLDYDYTGPRNDDFNAMDQDFVFQVKLINSAGEISSLPDSNYLVFADWVNTLRGSGNSTRLFEKNPESGADIIDTTIETTFAMIKEGSGQPDVNAALSSGDTVKTSFSETPWNVKKNIIILGRNPENGADWKGGIIGTLPNNSFSVRPDGTGVFYLTMMQSDTWSVWSSVTTILNIMATEENVPGSMSKDHGINNYEAIMQTAFPLVDGRILLPLVVGERPNEDSTQPLSFGLFQ